MLNQLSNKVFALNWDNEKLKQTPWFNSKPFGGANEEKLSVDSGVEEKQTPICYSKKPKEKQSWTLRNCPVSLKFIVKFYR